MINEGQEPKQDVPNNIKEYLKAAESGEWKQYFLTKFLKAKNDYSDDLPAVNVEAHTLDEKGRIVRINKYKCRGNYVADLGWLLSGAIEEKVITNPELIRKIQQFKHHDFNYYHHKPTTKEEIDMINQILTDVIEYLKQ